jgi:tRNA-Thr(GGU) m(6)t(6)A37 methyltransferase TsaA
MVLERIGIIRSPYTPEEGAPRQGRLDPNVESIIEVDPQYEEGLSGIEDFSHIIVLYAFDRSSGWKSMVQTPWEKRLYGVFATRSPNRPNAIGITIVKLIEHSESILRVHGLDAFDGTAVLDLKPYVPRFDAINDADQGFVKEKS